jgi:hypothetical protein
MAFSSCQGERQPDAAGLVAVGTGVDEADAGQAFGRRRVLDQAGRQIDAGASRGDGEAQFGMEVRPGIGQRLAMPARQVGQALGRDG